MNSEAAAAEAIVAAAASIIALALDLLRLAVRVIAPVILGIAGLFVDAQTSLLNLCLPAVIRATKLALDPNSPGVRALATITLYGVLVAPGVYMLLILATHATSFVYCVAIGGAVGCVFGALGWLRTASRGDLPLSSLRFWE